jgi:hypothetical protein
MGGCRLLYYDADLLGSQYWELFSYPFHTEQGKGRLLNARTGLRYLYLLIIDGAPCHRNM